MAYSLRSSVDAGPRVEGQELGASWAVVNFSDFSGIVLPFLVPFVVRKPQTQLL